MRLLLLVFLPCFVLASETPDEPDKVEKYWENQASAFTAWFRKDYESILVESGLSQGDVDNIISSLVDQYVACFQGYFERYAAENSLSVSDLIAKDALNLKDKEIYFDAMFSESVYSCQLTAIENAGISVEQDSNEPENKAIGTNDR